MNNLTSDTTIEVEFEKYFTITAQTVENATINPNGVIEVFAGTNNSIEIKANEGYNLKEVTVNGSKQNLPLTDNKVTLNNIQKDYTIVVTVEKITFDITTSVLGSNGTLTEGKTVEYGDDFTIEFNPAEGYMVSAVYLDGAEVSLTDGVLKLENIKAAADVKVSFTKIPFSLLIEGNENSIINPVGLLTVFYGDSKSISIAAKEGYVVKNVFVNDVAQEVTSNNFTLELTEINENLVVKVVVEAETYEVLEGKDQEYTKGEDLVVRFSGALNLFVNLYINGELVDPENYTLTEGSTIVTLADEYLSSLKTGTYELKAEFLNGNTAKTTFTVEGNVENPDTGDKIAQYVLIGAVSLMAIVGLSICLNKKKFN